MIDFIRNIPKAELHVHIEGTFEPELMFEIANRNGYKIKYKSVEELKSVYNFRNLQEFLDIYYEGTNVLIHERDFYDLTHAYLKKAQEQNIVHTEIFFDPQSHTKRGIKFETVIAGIQKALNDAHKKWGITSKLIPNFLRHLSEADAIQTFHEALKYKHLITGFGLDSSELGNPPEKFKRVFEMVKKEGFLTLAHAGEEGPASNVWDAIRILKVSRIDHGIRSVDDELLVSELAANQIPLTICPLSNLKLKAIKNMEELPLKILMDKGVLVTVNSDDPSYFGGYINENYQSVATAFKLNISHIKQLAKNSFTASFLDDKTKMYWVNEVENYCEATKQELTQ